MWWFIPAIVATLAWGTADLFYKKGADPADKYSYLKTVIMVGLIMGLHAVYVLVVELLYEIRDNFFLVSLLNSVYIL